MPGEREKIDAVILHVEWTDARCLGRINRKTDLGLLCQCADFGARLDGSCYIGSVINQNQTGFRRQ